MGSKVNQSDDVNEKPGPVRKRNRKRVLLQRILAIVLTISFIFLGMVFGYYFGYKAFSDNGGYGSGREVTITVTQGESVPEIAADLMKNGLIDDRLVFVFQAYFYSYKIVPGTYVLNDSMTYEEIFIQLEGGGS